MTKTKTAKPFEARYCPECDAWIYTADGPFAEDDRTKTVADYIHWAVEHSLDLPDADDFFPFFDWNDKTVTAEICREASPLPAADYKNMVDSWKIMGRELPSEICSV